MSARGSNHPLLPPEFVKSFDQYFEENPETVKALVSNSFDIPTILMIRQYLQSELRILYSNRYANDLIREHFPDPQKDLEQAQSVFQHYLLIKNNNLPIL